MVTNSPASLSRSCDLRVVRCGVPSNSSCDVAESTDVDERCAAVTELHHKHRDGLNFDEASHISESPCGTQWFGSSDKEVSLLSGGGRQTCWPCSETCDVASSLDVTHYCQCQPLVPHGFRGQDPSSQSIPLSMQPLQSAAFIHLPVLSEHILAQPRLLLSNAIPPGSVSSNFFFTLLISSGRQD